MASEGGQREEGIVDHGCNYYGKTVMRSCPFGSFMRNDVLQLALDMDIWYHDHLDIFEKKFHEQPYGKNREYIPVDSIIPKVYGEIRRKPNGDLYTTKAQRTGCSMCGFGIHMEPRPHRFEMIFLTGDGLKDFWILFRCPNGKNTALDSQENMNIL